MPIYFLVFITMIAFAANSLLCRMALGGETIDAASFTALRLCSGALFLGGIVWWNHHISKETPIGKPDPIASLMLFIYGICFSFAYLKLTTGTGALILFAMVQFTMLAAAIRRGEKPTLRSWLGIAIAFSGMIYLLSPGITTPSWQGGVLMSISGIAWGIYSLRGAKASTPAINTAWNFIGTVPLVLVSLVPYWESLHISPLGIILAITSGTIASGLGYLMWYSVLRHIKASTAATVQLSVPLIAAVAGVVFLSEPLTTRLAVAGTAILGGIALVITNKSRLAK